ncbi:MAG: BlaI/MecI/CopY family transcriptional regulator [Bacteroidota bacterium]
MKKLTKKEDQIMQVIWKLDKAFIKEIIEELPANSKGKKPHYNTVATLVKILEKKGFLNAELLGNSYRYTPAIDITEYRDDDLQEIRKKYFGDSLPKMLAHFAKSEKLSDKEREELIKIIQEGKDKDS